MCGILFQLPPDISLSVKETLRMIRLLEFEVAIQNPKSQPSTLFGKQKKEKPRQPRVSFSASRSAKLSNFSFCSASNAFTRPHNQNNFHQPQQPLTNFAFVDFFVGFQPTKSVGQFTWWKTFTDHFRRKFSGWSKTPDSGPRDCTALQQCLLFSHQSSFLFLHLGSDQTAGKVGWHPVGIHLPFLRVRIGHTKKYL